MKIFNITITIILILLFTFSYKVIAQNDLNTIRVNHSAVRIFSTLSFAEDNRQEKIPFKVLKKEGALGCIIKQVDIQIESGDLILEFDLESNGTGYFAIQIEKIEHLTNGLLFPILPERLYGDYGKEIKVADGHRKKIIIANGAENANPFWLSGKVSIDLSVQIYDYITYRGRLFQTKVRCDQPVQGLKLLKFKKGYLPTLIGAGIAGGFYGYGIQLRNDSDKIYDQYQLHRTKEAAESDYQSANKKYQDSERFKKIGIGVGAATLTWTIIQQLMQAERKRTYNCKCKGEGKNCDRRNVQLFNNIVPGVDGNSLAVGIGIRYNF
nr:hypothetical protein [uncultured bacterium]